MAAPNETPGQTAQIASKHLGVQEAHRQFVELIGQIHDAGETIIVERSGAPVAAILPIELYERLLGQSPEMAPSTLFGAFPELAALDDHDLETAKRVWEAGVEKQVQILQENP